MLSPKEFSKYKKGKTKFICQFCTEYTCIICDSHVEYGQKGVLCTSCNLWIYRKIMKAGITTRVGKGGHTPPPFLDQPLPFSTISPFLEIQDVPTFYRFIEKTKVLNNSCNQFVSNFYPQSILVLEECLQKW